MTKGKSKRGRREKSFRENQIFRHFHLAAFENESTPKVESSKLKALHVKLKPLLQKMVELSYY
jgi:hypothetical protein